MEVRTMLIDARATLVTTVLRGGSATLISMSGSLDGPVAAMTAGSLLDQADVANGDFHLDLRSVDAVDGAECVLVAALQRRLVVRGHRLHRTSEGARVRSVRSRSCTAEHERRRSSR
jgi:hypothetical protein